MYIHRSRAQPVVRGLNDDVYFRVNNGPEVSIPVEPKTAELLQVATTSYVVGKAIKQALSDKQTRKEFY
jgi:hypothetical protein